jgi:hypothetical protein
LVLDRSPAPHQTRQHAARPLRAPLGDAREILRKRLECGTQSPIAIEHHRPAGVQRLNRGTVVARNQMLHRRADRTFDIGMGDD